MVIIILMIMMKVKERNRSKVVYKNDANDNIKL